MIQKIMTRRIRIWIAGFIFLDFNDALDDVGDNSLGEGVILPAVNLAIFTNSRTINRTRRVM